VLERRPGVLVVLRNNVPLGTANVNFCTKSGSTTTINCPSLGASTSEDLGKTTFSRKWERRQRLNLGLQRGAVIQGLVEEVLPVTTLPAFPRFFLSDPAHTPSTPSRTQQGFPSSSLRLPIFENPRRTTLPVSYHLSHTFLSCSDCVSPRRP